MYICFRNSHFFIFLFFYFERYSAIFFLETSTIFLKTFFSKKKNIRAKEGRTSVAFFVFLFHFCFFLHYPFLFPRHCLLLPYSFPFFHSPDAYSFFSLFPSFLLLAPFFHLSTIIQSQPSDSDLCGSTQVLASKFMPFFLFSSIFKDISPKISMIPHRFRIYVTDLGFYFYFFKPYYLP